MRLVCTACGSRYHIADDRVRGKIVKIRCRQCANVLEAHLPGRPRSVADHRPPQPPPRPPPLPEKEWFVAVGGKVVGPVSLAELRLAVSTREIGPDDLIWRAGLEGWQPIALVGPVNERVQQPLAAPAGLSYSAPWIPVIAAPASPAQIQGSASARWPIWLLAVGGVTLMVAITIVLVMRTGQSPIQEASPLQQQRCPPAPVQSPVTVPLHAHEQPEAQAAPPAPRVVLKNPPPIQASRPRPASERRRRAPGLWRGSGDAGPARDSSDADVEQGSEDAGFLDDLEAMGID